MYVIKIDPCWWRTDKIKKAITKFISNHFFKYKCNKPKTRISYTEQKDNIYCFDIVSNLTYNKKVSKVVDFMENNIYNNSIKKMERQNRY